MRWRPEGAQTKAKYTKGGCTKKQQWEKKAERGESNLKVLFHLLTICFKIIGGYPKDPVPL